MRRSLPGARVADIGPGRQLVTVIGKGTRAVQPLPTPPDVFAWLRLYQVQLAGVAPSDEISRCGGIASSAAGSSALLNGFNGSVEF
jgi:hypothetical protein